MHKNVEILIGRLATDPGLQDRFAEAPRQALVEQGLEISEIESEALAATDPTAIRAFAATLDARIRRARTTVECHEPHTTIPGQTK